MSRRELIRFIHDLQTVRPALQEVASPLVVDDFYCFDVFRHLTARSATGFSPQSSFWEQTVLQLAHAEPAVRYATVALGALHRRVLMLPSSTGHLSDSHVSQLFATAALSSYCKSLKLAQSIRDPATLIVLSILLLSISNLNGMWKDSQAHILSAKRLLAEIKDRAASTNVINHAGECLARMDLQAAAFSESSAPYPFGSDGDQVHLPGPCKTEPTPIESLHKATVGIFDLLRTLLNIAGPLDGESLDPQSAMRFGNVANETTMWEASMSEYLVRVPSPNPAPLLLVKLYHSTVRLLLATNFSGPESRYDACLQYFERIIQLCAALLQSDDRSDGPVLSLEPGIVMPLYLTTTRCRHPAVRRHALALLRLSNRQEGMWPSVGAAAVAASIIAVEEDGLGIQLPQSGSSLRASDLDRFAGCISDESNHEWVSSSREWRAQSTWKGVPLVPERNRVVDSTFLANIDKRKVEITLVLSGREVDGSHIEKHVSVEF